MTFDLDREALTASGVKDEEQIRHYLSKLDSLFHRYSFEKHHNFPQRSQAEKLFKALWKDKPNRYRQKGCFRLNEVIDAQLGKECGPVGNCLGLTLLYNCMVKRMGFETKALYLERAFGVGPHVLTILKMEDLEIDVENILPDGFDYRGHGQDPTRQTWGDKELVADIYQSIGSELFEKGELRKALRSYDMAFELNPAYEKIKLNRAILFDKMKIDG